MSQALQGHVPALRLGFRAAECLIKELSDSDWVNWLRINIQTRPEWLPTALQPCRSRSLMWFLTSWVQPTSWLLQKCCILFYFFIFKNADTYVLFENSISARKNNVRCMSSLHGKTGRSARLCRSPWSPARLCCLTSRSTGWLCVSPPTSQDRCAVWLLASCKQPWRTNPALCSFVSLTQSATPANPLFLSLSFFWLLKCF